MNSYFFIISLLIAPISLYAELNITKKHHDEPSTINVGYISLVDRIEDFNETVKTLKKMSDDPVDAIILHINSPGGSPGTAEIIAEFILWVREKKPVIGFISHMGASAAYTIAAACTCIIAPETAQIGSIGVVMELPKKNKTLAFTGGKFKRVHYLADGVIDPEDATILQKRVDENYVIFCNYIAKLRNIPVETVRSLEAQMYLGSQARTLGLIDEVGTLQQVFNKAVELIGPTKNAPPETLRLIISPTESYEFSL